jgi:predicted HNH restriction endonuclease
LPEETIDVTKVVEGAIQSVLVNSYERSELARERCIAHYGTACSVCGIELGSVYGKAGEGLIHVHHLQQLSDAEKEHVVDPVRDLRPVCPNCHAIIHRRSPPYTIEEVRGFLGKQNDYEEKCVA